MIKFLYGLVKRPDISHEEFWTRWHIDHAALSLELAPITGMRKYIQNRGVHLALSKLFADERRGPPPFDGFAESWFDSLEALDSVRKTPEGAAAFERLLVDEQRFLDTSKCVITIVEEHSIQGSTLNYVA